MPRNFVFRCCGAAPDCVDCCWPAADPLAVILERSSSCLESLFLICSSSNCLMSTCMCVCVCAQKKREENDERCECESSIIIATTRKSATPYLIIIIHRQTQSPSLGIRFFQKYNNNNVHVAAAAAAAATANEDDLVLLRLPLSCCWHKRKKSDHHFYSLSNNNWQVG